MSTLWQNMSILYCGISNDDNENKNDDNYINDAIYNSCIKMNSQY